MDAQEYPYSVFFIGQLNTQNEDNAYNPAELFAT